MRGDKVKKVFVWRLTEKNEVKELLEFQRKSVFLGRPPAENLAMLVRRFNVENPVECTLTSEADMLKWLKGKKLGMTRQTLKAFRDRECPDGFDEGGIRIWASDGAAIIYNKEGMTEFIRSAKKWRKG